MPRMLQMHRQVLLPLMRFAADRYSLTVHQLIRTLVLQVLLSTIFQQREGRQTLQIMGPGAAGWQTVLFIILPRMLPWLPEIRSISALKETALMQMVLGYGLIMVRMDFSVMPVI